MKPMPSTAIAMSISLLLLILLTGCVTTTPKNYILEKPIAYCDLYINDSNALPVSVAPGTTYSQVLDWSNGDYNRNCFHPSSNGHLEVQLPGVYRLCNNTSFSSERNNTNWFGAGFLNGSELDNCHWQRSIGTANQVGSAGFCCLIQAEKDSNIDFRLRHDNSLDTNFSITYSQLVAELIETN